MRILPLPVPNSIDGHSFRLILLIERKVKGESLPKLKKNDFFALGFYSKIIIFSDGCCEWRRSNLPNCGVVTSFLYEASVKVIQNMLTNEPYL
jgi:hypothetical protein